MNEELTVGKLIEILSKHPKDMATYFGVKLKFNPEDSTSYEFDDWLEYKDSKVGIQAYKDNGKTVTREVLEIELKY